MVMLLTSKLGSCSIKGASKNEVAAALAKADQAQATADSAASAAQANAADTSGLSNEVDAVDARLGTLEARPAVNAISDAIDGIRNAGEVVTASEKAVVGIKSFLAGWGCAEAAQESLTAEGRR